MVIAHNILANNAQRQFNIVGNNKRKSTEKLASGYRINRAADDAAGLSISEKMRYQIRGLNKASNNCADGISLLQVADGALSDVSDMIHRITELSIQSANDTNTPEDRKAIQGEISQILEEIDKISDETSFNTRKLFSIEKKSDLPSQAPDNPIPSMGGSSKLMSSSIISVDSYIESIGRIDNARYLSGWSEGTYTINGGTAINDTDGSKLYIEYGKNNVKIYAQGPECEVQLIVPDDYTSTELRKALDGGSFDVKFVDSPTLRMTSIQDCAQTGYVNTYYSPKDGALNLKYTAGLTKETINALGYDPKEFCNDLYLGYNDYNTLYLKNPTTGVKEYYYMTDASKSALQSSSAKNIPYGVNFPINYSNGREEVCLMIKTEDTEFDSYSHTGIRNLKLSYEGIINTLLSDPGEMDYFEKHSAVFGASTYTVTDMRTKDNEELPPKNPIPPTKPNKPHDYGPVTGLWIQSGALEGQGIFLEIDPMNTDILGINGLDVTTGSGAQDSIERSQRALDKVSANRSKIGAQHNRLEHTIANVDNAAENTQSAESRIRDTDIATEMVSYARHNILEQAGISVITQANQIQQGMLALIS